MTLTRRHVTLGLAAAVVAGQARAGACAWPQWAVTLDADLERMARDLTQRLKPWRGPKRVLTPEQFGYAGGTATPAIQAAIEAAARQGGGTVRLAHGDYVSGTLDLRTGIRLEIAKGARLLASLDISDYPERVARRRTVQDTNMGMNQSLIHAEGCADIALAGEGTIDGRGASFKGDETIHGTPGRPFVVRVIDCQRVHVSGLTLLDSPCWMQNYLNCDDLLIENLHVENQANFNNDGLDIDGCRGVIVRHCHISSGDDALCFKGASQAPTQDVLIEHCTLYSSCNALKLGTDSQSVFRNVLARHLEIGGVTDAMRHIKPVGADSGISWEMVDGGTAENIMARDIHIVHARSPLFLRLDDRGRVKPEDPKPGIGTLRRIVFDRITGEDNGPKGSYFLGMPEKAIADVALRDIAIRGQSGAGPAPDEATIGEMHLAYPDAHMLTGNAPAYGLWTRHVNGLSLHNVRFTPDGAETRPMLKITDDTTGVCLS